MIETSNEPGALPSRHEAEAGPARDVRAAMANGARCRCPACGRGALYRAYLKVVDACGACGSEMHHHRADDAPPYFTIFIVGHIVVGGILAAEKWLHPPIWTQLVFWLPVTLILSLALLPPIKGALIGLQWALGMHGFGPAARGDEDVGMR